MGNQLMVFLFYLTIFHKGVLTFDIIRNPFSDSSASVLINNHVKELGNLIDFQGVVSFDSSLNTLRERVRKQLSLYADEVKLVHSLELGDTSSESSLSRSKRDTIRADKLTSGAARRRRNYVVNPYDLSTLDAGITHVVKRAYQLQKPSFDQLNVTDLNSMTYHGTIFIFAVEKSSTTTFTVVYRFVKNWDLEEIGRFETPGALIVELIEIEGYYYILPAAYEPIHEYSLEDGSNLYRIDFSNGFKAEKIQTISTEFARSITFWRSSGVDANDVILCVAPEKKWTVNGYRYKVDISCYRWQGGYFDLTYSVPASNPKAVRLMSIASHNYMCVANYQDDSGSTSTFSTIYRYSHKKGNFVPFQKILTHGAMDCQYFRFDSEEQVKEHYLAIANFGQVDEYGKVDYNVKSYIFKFGVGRFILHQSLVTFGAFEILSIQDGPKFLLIIGEMYRLSIYQHNGWNFVKTREIPLSNENLVQQFRMRPMLSEDQTYFTVASPSLPVESGVYGLEYEGRNDYVTMTNDLEQWCVEAVKTVESTDLNQLAVQASQVPNSTEPEITVKSSLVFASNLRANNIFTQSLEYKGVYFNGERSNKLASQEARLHVLESQTNELKSTLANVISLAGHQTIKTHVEFSEMDIVNQTIHMTDLNADHLNDIDTWDLVTRAVFLNQQYTLNFVDIDLLPTSHEIQAAKLDGKPITDLVLKSTTEIQSFLEENIFLQHVSALSGLEVAGYINRVKPSNILTVESNQLFDEISVTYATVLNLAAKIVNEIDMERLLSTSIPKTGQHEIHADKFFSKNVSSSRTQVEKLLSNIHLESIFNQAIYLSNINNSTFSDTPVFENVIVDNLELENKLINNNYDLSKDFVSIRNYSYQVDELNIYSDVGIGVLDIQNNLNDIPIQNKELDVLLQYSPVPNVVQHLYGHNLHKLRLEQSSSLDGTINSVDIKTWSQTKVIELENPVIVGDVFATDIHFSSQHDVTVENFEQGTNNVLAILEKSTPLNSGEFQCRPIFESVLVQKNAQVNVLNSNSPSQDWVTRYNSNSTIIIGGEKHFFGDITLLRSSTTTNGLYILEDIYNPFSQIEVFTELQNIVVDGMDQTLSGNFIVNEVLKVQNIQTHSPQGQEITLEGVNFANIIHTVPDQSILVKSITDQVINIESSLHVNENIHSTLISGIELEPLINDTLRTESHETQTISRNLQFSNGLYINHNVYTQGKLGSYEIDQLFSNIVPNVPSSPESKNVVIGGSLLFKKEANISSLDFYQSINGITPDQWGSHWMTRRGNQEITTPLYFINSVNVTHTYVQDDKISNVDIVQLDQDIIRKDQEGEPISLGSAKFQSDIIIEGSICSSSFNSYDVSRDLLRKTQVSEQTITGTKTFKGNWKVEGNLNAHHLTNNDFWNAFRFSSMKSKSDEDLIIHGDCYAEKEPIITVSSERESTLNNFNWQNLLDSIWFSNEDTIIELPIQFDSVHLNSGGVVVGSIDGVDVIALERDYLSLTKDQNWIGNFQFDSQVIFEQGLNTNSTDLYNGSLNGLDIPRFVQSVLLDEPELSQNIASKFIFKSLTAPSLTIIMGNTNGIDFCKDVATIDGRGGNLVTGLKHLQTLSVGNLKLERGARVNGVSVDWWRDLALSTKGNFELNGERIFEVADFTDLQVNGLVDGKFVSYDTVMTLQGRQSGTGDLILENENNHITSFSRLYAGGTVNGEKIDQYFDNMVIVNNTDNKPLYIYGNKSIHGNVHTDWLKTEGRYEQHGINVVEFLQNYSVDTYVGHNFNEVLEEKYAKMSNLATGLIQIAEDRAVLIRCFEDSSTLNLSNVVWLKVLHGLKEQPMISLVVRNHVHDEVAYWFTYNVNTNSYEMYRNARGRIRGMIVDQAEIERKGQYYLFASVSTVNNVEVTSTFPEHRSPIDFELNDGTHKLSQGVVLILREDSTGALDLNVFQVVYGDRFGKVLSFYIVTLSGSRRDCILYSVLDQNNYHASVYCFNSLDFQGQDDDAVHFFQEIPLGEEPELTSIVIESKTLVIMSSGDDVNKTKLSHGVVNVWAHEQGDGLFVKEDSFPIVNVISMDSVLAPNNNPFLAAASGKLSSTMHSGLVYVYKYSLYKKRFIKYQTIHEDNPIMVKFQRIGPSDDIFLYILTGNTKNNVNVYSFKGVSGWVKEFSFTSSNAHLLEPAVFYYQENYRAHVLTASLTDVNVIDIEFNGIPST